MAVMHGRSVFKSYVNNNYKYCYDNKRENLTTNETKTLQDTNNRTQIDYSKNCKYHGTLLDTETYMFTLFTFVEIE